MTHFMVLPFLFSLLFTSCGFSNAQPPETTSTLKFEKQFHKNNIKGLEPFIRPGHTAK